MIDPKVLTEDILYAVGNASGTFDIYPERKLNPSELAAVHTDVASMEPAIVFMHYCTWHGLIGWASRLTSVMENIKKAEVKPMPPREDGVNELIQPFRSWITANPVVTSFLYDMDMLPEQCRTLKGAHHLVAVCLAWQIAYKRGLAAADTNQSESMGQ